MIYFTSDLHFSHHNVIHYCNRPYKDIDEMNEAIIKQWNSQVKPEDTVYVLGDFSLNAKWSEIFLPRLNGTKHICGGNHDSFFPYNHGRKNKKADFWKQEYLRHGWKTVQLNKELKLKRHHGFRGLFCKSYKVKMGHFPPGPSAKHAYNFDKRYMDMRPVDDGSIILHGHSHNWYIKSKNLIDVGFDGSLKLLSERDIIDLIEDKREFIPSRITEFFKAKEKEDVQY